jgi:hypothetical protein
MTHSTSSFELAYTRKVNTYGFLLLAVHLPVLCALALAMGNSVLLPIVAMVLILAVPAIILANDRSSQIAAIALGVAAMCVCALTIHVANGVIEAHFEIFVLIAMLAVFGRTLPLIAAAVTIALHHLLFWKFLPCSVFNHQAGISIVLIHAFFVVLEVVPLCWIAEQFGRAIQAQGIVMELRVAASQIESASGQIASASQSLAQGASEQSAHIKETSVSIEEIAAMSRRNSENSSASSSIAAETEERFAASNSSLDQMVSAMDRINSSSEEISRIVKVIDQIAFQTNILALNAAVEAARAGEAGMGFAVVADEVRNLAHRSAQASKETATLIEESIANSRAGKGIVDQVAAQFREISGDSSRIKGLVDEIALGSSQQSTGLTGISRAIQQIEQVTQTNAAGAEKTASAADELAAQSRVLNAIVSRLEGLGSAVGGDDIRFERKPVAVTKQNPARLRPLLKTIGRAVPVVKSLKVPLNFKTEKPVAVGKEKPVAVGKGKTTKTGQPKVAVVGKQKAASVSKQKAISVGKPKAVTVSKPVLTVVPSSEFNTIFPMDGDFSEF